MRLRTLRNSVLLFLLILAVASVFIFTQLTGYSQRCKEAKLLLAEWRLSEAEHAFGRLSVDYPDSLEVRRLYAITLMNRGEPARAAGEYRFLARADTAHRLSHTLSLATAFLFLGELDSSAALAERVSAETSQGWHPDLLAQSLHILGRIAFNRGTYGSALSLQHRSLALARDAGSPQSEANALRQIGVLYWYAGKPDSASHAFYEPALEIYRRINDRIGEATTLNNIGLAMGGIPLLLEAFSLRRKIGDQIGLADSYYFVTSPVEVGHWNDQSYRFRVKSLQLSTAIGYAWGREVAARAVDQMAFGLHDSLSFERALAESTSSSGEGMILRLQLQSSKLMRDHRLDEAAALRERIVFLCDSLGYAPGLGVALAQYALILTRLGRYDQAERVVTRMRGVWADRPNHVDSFQARIHQDKGEHRKAADLLLTMIQRHNIQYQDNIEQNMVRFFAGSRHLPFRQILFEMYIQSLNILGDVEKGFDAFERFRISTSALSPQTQGVGATDPGTELWQSYHRILDVIDKGDPSADSLVANFRTTYDRQKREYSSFLQSLLPINQFIPPTLRGVQGALHPDEVLLEFFLGQDDAFLIAVRKEGTGFLRIPVPTTDLNSSAGTLAELLFRGKDSPEDSLWKIPAQFLFHCLLQPLVSERLLRDGDHVIISPHGRLAGLPFAALMDSSGRYLIERFSVSYVTSSAQIGKAPLRTATGGAMVFAPDTTTLHHANAEAASIPDSVFGLKTILRTEQATVNNFIRQSSSASLIHLIAHGVVDRLQPLSSRIRMWDGPIEMHALLSSRVDATLVVLSACETGTSLGVFGDISSGHTMVGFPEAFLWIGAGCVLSPLWTVEDESTSQLIRQFYIHLSAMAEPVGHFPGRAFARALALAQQGALRQGKHPFYWAAFGLKGVPG